MTTRSTRYALAGVFVIGLLAAAVLYLATRLSYAVPPAPDYANGSSWLCRPSRVDSCAAPTTATILDPGSGKRIETIKPDPAAPIDCFYVYPTVSRARTAYSAIGLGAEETWVARRQLAPFGSVCRTFAPLYRQVTGKALPDLFAGRNGVTIDVPYADVLAAWRNYLAKDNGGRGFVLIGHSQGARLLARLIKEEIDGKAIAAKLVSAVIPGTRVDVPPGQAVGGSFRQTPVCAAATQTGCVIAYSSYPAGAIIPETTRFGLTKTPGMRYACVDPAAIDGASSLDPYFSVPPELVTIYSTDFVAMPGLLHAKCTDDGHFSVLSIKMPSAGASKELFHELAAIDPVWGLHSADVNLTFGNLLDLVRRQTSTYLHH